MTPSLLPPTSRKTDSPLMPTMVAVIFWPGAMRRNCFFSSWLKRSAKLSSVMLMMYLLSAADW